MSALTKKLWRTVRNTRGQFLAVAAVVAVGISVYISMTTAFYNLNHSRDTFYRENDFAGYYFHVVKAPQEITRQIKAVPGVAAVTGRIQKDVPVLKENSQRATARLTGYPLPAEGELNRLSLLAGRLFEKYPEGGRSEVLLDPRYAAANRLAPGDTVSIVAEGRVVYLTVAGAATGPEFVYPMKDPASLMPEPKTFGIFMIPQNQAQQILNMSGQINQVLIKLVPGADEEKAARQVKAILEPYGNLAAYPAKQQLSNAVLQGELDGLKSASLYLPLIFLFIAAAIQFVMVGRMIKSQRLQIGVMKALGYNSRQLMLHYSAYSLVIALSGALLGTMMGLLLATVISRAYAQFFNLPAAISGVNFKAILYGLALSLSVGAAAGLTASRGVAAISPAESMRPEPPRGTGRNFLENWAWLWGKLDPTWKMGIRAIARNRGRTGLTLLGVIFAVGLLVMSLFARDSIDYMLNRHFFGEQHYDYLIRFAAPLKENELSSISRLEGVLKVEPLFEIPVKMRFGGRSEDDILLGLPADLTLKELHNETGKTVPLPDEGVLISDRTAGKLGARVGDTVTVETLLGFGPSRTAALKVAGVNRQLIGGGSCIALAQANRILQESGLVSGAMLKVDPGQAGQVEEELDKMTGVSSILSREKELKNFNQNLGSMVYSISIMVTFALILGFAIIFNSSVISFSERKRELASLRVMGLTAGEVSGLLLRENLLQSLLGVALGLPFGRFIAGQYIKSTSTDLFAVPVVVYPVTYALSAIGGIFFIMVAHRVASKGIKKLDLVDVLKNRD